MEFYNILSSVNDQNSHKSLTLLQKMFYSGFQDCGRGSFCQSHLLMPGPSQTELYIYCCENYIYAFYIITYTLSHIPKRTKIKK